MPEDIYIITDSEKKPPRNAIIIIIVMLFRRDSLCSCLNRIIHVNR